MPKDQMYTIRPDDIEAVLCRAKALGLRGFGGHCASAAVAINRVLFDGRGEIIGIFNGAFESKDRLIGHVVVDFEGIYWDADATPKGADDVEHWGMLDHEDTDYKDEAKRLGFTFSEAQSMFADFFAMDNENELFSYFSNEALEKNLNILRQALQERPFLSIV